MTQDSNIDAAGASRKGRATPSRKEAEAARKKAMKRPLTRKEQLQRERRARTELRRKQQAALRAGEGEYLPPRDRGPVRALARDVVDRRRNIAEYMLPILLVALTLSFVPQAWAQLIVLYTWAVMLILVIVDWFVLSRTLKRELRDRLPGSPTKGATFYTLVRSTQLRRFRLPKPSIERGAPLKPRY